MRATFILVLILFLGPCCKGFAVPLETVPAPAVYSNDSPALSSGAANGAQPTVTPPRSASASSVPGEDPIVGGTQAVPAPPKIPKFPVQMYVRMGTSSHFQLFFLNVKYGYDLKDFQFYSAWCIRKGAPLPGHTVHTVRLYNSSGPNLPPEFKRMQWRQINYLINHKKGSRQDLQLAIWRMAKCCSTTTKMSPGALRLIHEANLKGKDYTPVAGDLVAIICEPLVREQPLFIEYKIPENIPPAVKAGDFYPCCRAIGGKFCKQVLYSAFFLLARWRVVGSALSYDSYSRAFQPAFLSNRDARNPSVVESGKTASRPPVALPVPGVRIGKLPG